jgi:hypothetical protein
MSTAPPPPSSLSIGELSRHTGVNIETIRYYERIKMLPAPLRTSNGRRVYGLTETRHDIVILLEVGFARPGRALNRPTWSPVKGSSASLPPIGSATVVRQRFFGIPATNTDIISAQHFWRQSRDGYAGAVRGPAIASWPPSLPRLRLVDRRGISNAAR